MSAMPELFIGHGSPMNTLEDNGYTRAWRKLGQALPAICRWQRGAKFLPFENKTGHQCSIQLRRTVQDRAQF
jgi:hypothetical protein